MLRQNVKRWKDVPGIFEKELEHGMLRIHFESSGGYDPGKTWGEPETCYPPEGEDERVLSSVFYQHHEDDFVCAIPQDVAEVLFNLYREEIQQVEIETATEYDDDRDSL